MSSNDNCLSQSPSVALTGAIRANSELPHRANKGGVVAVDIEQQFASFAAAANPPIPSTSGL
jgi:hypothetical protein